MMPFDFRTVMYTLEEFGLMDVLLPFLLIFSITFAIFEKIKIVEKRNVNMMIALAIALAVVIPHVTGSYPGGFDVVVIINTILPQISLILLAILLFLLMSGLLGTKNVLGQTMGLVISVLLIIFLFFGTIGYFYDISWLYEFFGEDAIVFLIVIVIFGLVIWMIVGGGEGGQKSGRPS